MRIKALTVVTLIALAVVLLVAVLGTVETRRRIQELESRSQVLATRHGSLEYREWGEGPPVVVIHGAGGGFDQGELLARAMGGEGFRWISVSRFGYLRSDLPRDASVQAQAEALVELLNALGITQAAVLAMSGGVPPALKLAEQFAERTGPLVLLSSAPFTPLGGDIQDRPVPTWVYSALLGNDVVYWLLTRIARNTLAEAFDATADLRADLPLSEQQFVDGLIDGFLPASRRLPGVRNEGAAVDPTIHYDLGAVRSAVLVVHARDDRLNPFAIGTAIANGIPGARMIAYERGGHLLLGHHEALAGEVAAFLHR